MLRIYAMWNKLMGTGQKDIKMAAFILTSRKYFVLTRVVPHHQLFTLQQQSIRVSLGSVWGSTDLRFKLVDSSWIAPTQTHNNVCTLAWKTYQFTQLHQRKQSCWWSLKLGGTRRVTISQLFDYSGKYLCQIDSVNGCLVAAPSYPLP